MAKTTFEEEIYLRTLTGRLVGKAIADLGANKLAVVAPKNIICSSIATATEAAFLDNTGGVTYHFLYEGNAQELAQRIEAFSPEVILLQFGGESSPEEIKEGFKAVVKALAEREVIADIVVHVRTYAAGALDEALKDEDVKAYLANTGLYTYTVDFDNGRLIFNEVLLDEEADKGYHLAPVLEYHVTAEHANLLNKSLKDRELRWG